MGEYEEALKGRKEGRENILEIIFDFLKEHGEISENITEQLTAEKDLEKLRKWVRLAAKTGSMEDFAAGMQQQNS